MLALRLSILIVVFALLAGQANAQSSTKTGTITLGSDGTDIAQTFHDSGWNTGGFFCRTGSLIVWPSSPGPCSSRQVVTSFIVLTGGGTIQNPTGHSYTYHVACVGSTILHEVGFDGASLTSINSGTFDFPLSGGDTLRLVTTEGPLSLVPAIQPVWYVALLLLLLAAGTLLFLRRRLNATAR
jgi:hypothetical protein